MKRFIATLLFICLTLSANAQNRKEQIKALKVAHITERLDLTEKEAQRFWPIYNAYDDKVFELKFKKIKKMRHEIKQNIDTISDEEAQELINKIAKAENDLHNEHIQLTAKLKNIISPKKILLLKIAEDEFNRKLFEQFKRRRQGFKNKN